MKESDILQQKPKSDLIDLIINYKAKIVALEEKLLLINQRHFGRKSEKTSEEKKQLELFNEADNPKNIDEIKSTEETITIAAYNRKKKGRKPLPKDLPRIRQEHDLPDSQKICPCGYQLTRIGEEKTEQLDIIPAKMQVIEHVKFKYACKDCEETIKTATGAKLPIPKSIASPGLLAHVLVSKYKDHLPLYRQENIFQRIGVDIARNTLAHWVIKSSEILLPLYKLLQNEIINYDISYADETRVQVLREPGRKATSESYMWVFIGGELKRRSIIYSYDPGRSHTVIERILEDFSGYLHCDGFSGYDAYATDHNVSLIGCWMHARRKFVEITKTTKTEGLAHYAVKIIGKLYKIEKYLKSRKYTADEIYEYRQKHTKPILDKIKSWLDENHQKVLPKSPIGGAISYCINQWPKLIRYVNDGRLEIDNGLSERTIKPFVIGRKNWMFSSSIAGIKAGEIIYSIIETCMFHKVEPYAYLRKVLTELPNVSTESHLQKLLPFTIDTS